MRSGKAAEDTTSVLDLLFRRLEHFVPLSPADREALQSHVGRVERVGPNVDLFKEGGDPHGVYIVLEGWACRSRQLEDGRRQLLTFFLPGDMCDPGVFMLHRMSHTLSTLTPATVVRISGERMVALMQETTLIRALWFDLMTSIERQREWTVSLGRRTATERMAHLFCEVIARMRMVGLADARGCDMPVTQADLGDALGLSTVHVNRTLQELRALRLVDLRGRRLVVSDEPGLQALALFDPTYLHLQRDTPESRPR